jgi:hypothetical protein
MTDPELIVGAVHVTVADVVPPTAVTFVGAPGRRSLGVTGAEELENEPAPTVLMAAALKVYTSPLVRPVTVQVVSALDVEVGHASVMTVEVVVSSAVTL